MGAERFFSEHPWETGRSGPRAGVSATSVHSHQNGARFFAAGAISFIVADS